MQLPRYTKSHSHTTYVIKHDPFDGVWGSSARVRFLLCRVPNRKPSQSTQTLRIETPEKANQPISVCVPTDARAHSRLVLGQYRSHRYQVWHLYPVTKEKTTKCPIGHRFPLFLSMLVKAASIQNPGMSVSGQHGHGTDSCFPRKATVTSLGRAAGRAPCTKRSECSLPRIRILLLLPPEAMKSSLLHPQRVVSVQSNLSERPSL